MADRLLASTSIRPRSPRPRPCSPPPSRRRSADAELHGGRIGGTARDLEYDLGLWAGVGLVRSGAGTALVGSHQEVADLLGQYRALGIEEFVLSGYPHIEEAYVPPRECSRWCAHSDERQNELLRTNAERQF